MSSNDLLEEEEEEDEDDADVDVDEDVAYDLGKTESRIPSEEEVNEISSIHHSPQKRTSHLNQSHNKLLSASRSPKGIIDLAGGTGDFMAKFPTEDKRGGFGSQMQMINEKAEHEFNDEESRIPFQGDNYMMEKSAMSIHFDFDTSHNQGT